MKGKIAVVYQQKVGLSEQLYQTQGLRELHPRSTRSNINDINIGQEKICPFIKIIKIQHRRIGRLIIF